MIHKELACILLAAACMVTFAACSGQGVPAVSDQESSSAVSSTEPSSEVEQPTESAAQESGTQEQPITQEQALQAEVVGFLNGMQLMDAGIMPEFQSVAQLDNSWTVPRLIYSVAKYEAYSAKIGYGEHEEIGVASYVEYAVLEKFGRELINPELTLGEIQAEKLPFDIRIQEDKLFWQGRGGSWDMLLVYPLGFEVRNGQYAVTCLDIIAVFGENSPEQEVWEMPALVMPGETPVGTYFFTPETGEGRFEITADLANLPAFEYVVEPRAGGGYSLVSKTASP